MKKAILTAVFLAALITPALADIGITAGASVDRNKVKLGDVISYTISVKREGNVSRSPEVAPPAFDGFRVSGSYSQNSVNIINNAASVVTNLQYDLICIKSGEITIPPARIRVFNDAAKKYDELQTKPVTIFVNPGKNTAAAAQAPSPTVEEDIKEIKMNVAFRFSDLIPYIILAVIFIAVVIFTWNLLFKKRVIAALPVEETDYRREALRKLKKAEEKLKNGEIKAFYYEIYEAVRYFLSMHLSASFAELTTQEILKKLGELKMSNAKVSNISDFMSDCDIVKFADYKPNEKEIEAAYKKAGEIIERLG
jgi:HEPN domain-containing protein